MKSVKTKRILIVGPNWVGDMVMAQSLFMLLKQNQPDCVIDVLAPAWTLPLTRHMPEVTAAIEIPLRRGEFAISKRVRLARDLARNGYEQAILLPNSLKSALIPLFARIPLRIGYLGEQRWGLLNDIRHLDKKLLRQTVQRFVALGLDSNAKLPPTCPEPHLVVSSADIEQARQKFEIDESSRGILGLCPGAEYGPAKRWPETHYAQLAQSRIEQGWAVWLFGSAKDREISARIDDATGSRCRNFAGLTNLNEAVALMSLCDQVVTNDSGLMHVAAALGKQLVALYGSSDPGFTPPLTSNARILSLNLDCSPCFKRECPLGHFRCLQDLNPRTVLECLDRADMHISN